MFYLSFFSPDKITKIKMCHTATKKHPEVIEGRRLLIDVDVLDSKEATEDTYVDRYGAVSDEGDGSGLLGAGVTEEVEYTQKSFKSSSLSSYMLKPSCLLTQGFENNRTAQEKLFKHMCNFGSQEEWSEGRKSVSSYLDVETTKYQCSILNPTPLVFITGYIMDDTVGNRDLKRLPQRRLNFIDGYISSYCSILNSPKRLEQIRQANNLASVLCDLESDHKKEN